MDSMENSAQIPSNEVLNPLLLLHQQVEAETQQYDSLEIVSTFGQPQLEYAALHKSCGLMDLPFRGTLKLTGKDRASFLNGLISNQTWDKNAKQPMPAGTWVYAYLLNLKGRIVADMNVIELGDAMFIDLDFRLVDAIREVFDKYQFSEQVTMKNVTNELHHLALFGPQIVSVLQPPSVLQHAGESLDFLSNSQSASRLVIEGIECVAFKDNPTGTDGAHLLVPRDKAQEVWTKLLAKFGESKELGKRQLRPIGWAAFNACRIEAGRALFGIDFAGVPAATAYPTKKQRDEAIGDDAAPGILPAETGALFSRAVNLSKCYIGQEIVARMYARQQSVRQIAGFKMSDDALPIAGAPVQDENGNQIGIVTSSTMSPRLTNAAIGFAFLKKPHFAVGTKVRIAAEGQIRGAEVVATPFLVRDEKT